MWTTFWQGGTTMAGRVLAVEMPAVAAGDIPAIAAKLRLARWIGQQLRRHGLDIAIEMVEKGLGLRAEAREVKTPPSTIITTSASIVAADTMDQTAEWD